MATEQRAAYMHGGACAKYGSLYIIDKRKGIKMGLLSNLVDGLRVRNTDEEEDYFLDDDYYDDGEEQREYEERKRQAEKIQRQYEEEQRKKYSEAIIKQKTQMAQKNWKSFSERYSKDQGIFLIQTIGAVVRGLTIIKNERMGIKNNYSYEEKQKILNTLSNNKNIIYMLIKARKEAERRRQEEEMLKVNEKELEKMKKEEEKRKAEEKKRIEEEKKRIEEEKRIAE